MSDGSDQYTLPNQHNRKKTKHSKEGLHETPECEWEIYIEQRHGHLQHHGHGAGVQQPHGVGGHRGARLPRPRGLGLQRHVKATLPTWGGRGDEGWGGRRERVTT